MEIREEIYVSIDGNWVLSLEKSGESAVYRLAKFLNAKYLEKAGYIKSVRRVHHYTHKTITFTIDNGAKHVFTVPAHF